MLSHQISGGKHCILLLIGRLRCERCLRLARATKGRAARHLNDAQQAVAVHVLSTRTSLRLPAALTRL